MRLFCYGTLLFPAVMQAVTGRRFTGVPAVLDDFACYTMRGEVYPGIVPVAGAQTDGCVYSGIGLAHLKQLDRFEGDLYERIRVCVTDGAGASLQAWVYVVPLTQHNRATRKRWNRESFAATHLTHFLQTRAQV